MADVVQKIISGNSIQQGTTVSHVNKMGTIHNIVPNVTSSTNVSDVETRFSNRFDDTEYYGTKFVPTTLSDCRLWLAADKITGLSDGDVVTTWSDSSAQSFDVTQSTTSKKPIYKTGIFNSKPAIKFDGTDDLLVNSSISSVITSASTYSMFMAFSYIAQGNYATVASIGGASYPMIRFFQLDSASPRNIRIEGKTASNSLATSATGSDVSVGSLYIGSVVNESPYITQYLNGLSDAAGDDYDFGDYSVDRIVLGASSAAGTPANCYIAEVVFYNRAVNEGERKRVENYLGRKYGNIMP